ncbi:hypothetical protein B0H14DRAFT_2631148 [Mycena olivaceomarginata]|nr:hypothetical protein B0H14DRAFT_2631148 [Mycena olivaceomarginata]
MLSPFSRCSDPRACTCFPPNISPPPHYYPQYPPGPASVPQTLPLSLRPWYPQYPPDLAPYNPYNTPTAQYNFRNNFQATYDRTAAQSAFLPFRIALGDATNTVGAAAAPNPRKRKRASGTTTNSEANTRRRLKHDSNIDAPAILVSARPLPLLPLPLLHPTRSTIRLSPISRTPAPSPTSPKKAPPRDARHFTRGAHMAAKPDSLPVENSISSTRPDRKKLPRIGPPGKTPKADNRHSESPQIRAWKAKDGTNLGTSSSNKNSPSGEREEFTLPSFLRQTNQSLDVVDCPELRDLFLFIAAQLEDEDIPRDKTGPAHFITDANGNLALKTQLVVFRRLEGSHAGDNLGKVFVQVLKEIGCLHKISMITCDNASTTERLMETTQRELMALGIPFDSEGNRITVSYGKARGLKGCLDKH